MVVVRPQDQCSLRPAPTTMVSFETLETIFVNEAKTLMFVMNYDGIEQVSSRETILFVC